jgi:hypothetical protein
MDSNNPFITLAEAAKLFPARRAGRKTHVNTLYRWSSSGCKGIRLRTFQCGATRVTTAADVREFVERLTQQRDEGEGDAAGAAAPMTPSPGGRTPSQRARGQQQAMKELAAKGLGE